MMMRDIGKEKSMQMFQDCWTTREVRGQDHRFLDLDKVSDLLEQMGFEANRVENMPYAHSYRLGNWHLWRCFRAGRCAWASAQLIGNRWQNHEWYYFDVVWDAALEFAVKRALGLMSEFRWIPDWPGFDGQVHEYFIDSRECDGWHTDEGLMPILVEDLRANLDAGTMDDDELCILEQKGWAYWIESLWVAGFTDRNDPIDLAKFNFDTWTWV